MATAETSTYRIVRGRHSRNEGGERKTYIVGDEIELTEAAAKRMGSAVEPLRTASGKTRSNTTSQTETAAKTDAVASARTAAPADGQTAAADADSTSTTTTAKSTGADFDFSFVDEATVTEVADHVSEVDDVAELRAMKRHEQKNKNRVGVIKAIDERIEDLK